MSYSVDPQNPIYKRTLRATKIKLKKDIKDNWGRFLDNHFDPDIHNKPFNAAMNAPRDMYKYSTAGLSHKFLSTKILQNYDLEDKIDRTKIIKRFKEAKELNEGDLFVFIEY